MKLVVTVRVADDTTGRVAGREFAVPSHVVTQEAQSPLLVDQVDYVVRKCIWELSQPAVAEGS